MSGQKNTEPEIHGPGTAGDDFLLCGLAPEAFETGCHSEPILMGRSGDEITCATCRRVIDHVRSAFRGYRIKKGGAA